MVSCCLELHGIVFTDDRGNFKHTEMALKDKISAVSVLTLIIRMEKTCDLDDSDHTMNCTHSHREHTVS